MVLGTIGVGAVEGRLGVSTKECTILGSGKVRVRMGCQAEETVIDGATPPYVVKVIVV